MTFTFTASNDPWVPHAVLRAGRRPRPTQGAFGTPGLLSERAQKIRRVKARRRKG